MRQWQLLEDVYNVRAPYLKPLSTIYQIAFLGPTIMLATIFSGCVSNGSGHAVSASFDKPISVQSTSESSAGHFLAARQALYFNDIEQSANFFLETLRDDNDNANLLRQTFMAQYYQGNITKAAALGRQMEQLNVSSAFSVEPATAIAIQAQDWQAVRVLASSISEHSPSRWLSALINAWAFVATGQGDAGITHLTESLEDRKRVSGSTNVDMELHIALMAEHLGQNEEATKRGLKLIDAPMTPITALHLASLLARNGENESAKGLIDRRLNASFNKVMIDKLLSEETSHAAPSLLSNIVHGIVDFSMLEQGESNQQMFVARLQLARFLDPKSDFVRLLLAQEQIKSKNYIEAVENLSAINVDGPLGQPAMVTLSDIAIDNGEFSEAALILHQAIAANPQDGYLYKLLGDCYRRNTDYKKSKDAYKKAYKNGHQTSSLHRNLGITLERLNQTKDAEEQLKLALKMNPDDAFALNYLGYWWADQGRNLEEAISLIERAVELRPDSGYFVDSLGWVHFRLGNAKRAVRFLEQATALEPADAEITGHLGDVYWYLGRRDEAIFKWRLAISLSKTKEERIKFRSRIETGIPSSEISEKNQ